VFAGFLASVLIGVPMAFCIVMSRAVERMVMPVIVASQAVPKVAIAPMLVIWLGFGLLPKIAITFLLAFFPLLVATSTGLRSVETEMLDLVRSMRASAWKIMFKVRLPAALPQIFSGLKVAIGLSVVGAVVGEFVGADRGLGYALLSASGALDGTLVWAALLILVGVGMASFQAIVAIERFARLRKGIAVDHLGRTQREQASTFSVDALATHPVPPQGLRTVHAGVRDLHEFDKGTRLLGERGHAERTRQPQCGAIRRDGRRGQRRPPSLRPLHGTFVPHAHEKHGELLAAQSAGQVTEPRGRAQHRSDGF